MQIKSKFTIAIHVILCTAMYEKEAKVTSSFLAQRIGVNAVIIRNIIAKLKEQDLIISKQGASGIHVAKSLESISLYDLYCFMDCVDQEGLFHMHENPNADCLIGRNLHKGLLPYLEKAQRTLEDQLKQISLAQIFENTKALISQES